MASEEYQARSQADTPAVTGGPSLYLTKTISNASQSHISSPLGKSQFSHEEIRDDSRTAKDSASIHSDANGSDDNVHLFPTQRFNKITGGQGKISETEDLSHQFGAYTEDNHLVENHDYHAPILASDEVAKTVGHEDMQPAVPPERRNSAFDEYGSGHHTPTSRPSSRPGSIYGVHHGSLSRFHTHEDKELSTPLEDVAEYEPLFPDDEEGKKQKQSWAERFKKRPNYSHRFPSQDIWEDTPDSAMHQASVSAPDLPRQVGPVADETAATSTFEHPAQEAARKEVVSDRERAKLVPREERLAKSQFAPHLRDDMPTRPGMQPRFPSQDIWEDTPDSHMYTTIITTNDEPHEEEEISSPIATQPSRPPIPPRPAQRSKLNEELSPPPAQPTLPARPPKQQHAVLPTDAQRTEAATLSGIEMSPTKTKPPGLPDRPKPQVPARPSKKESKESLNKVTSVGSNDSQTTEKGAPVTSPPITKAKPVVPSRPGQSSKFAALRGNFMSDLNQKLGVGPQEPPKAKEPEPEAEKEAAPLEDARKGRARGPQRRAPAKSPVAATSGSTPKLSFSHPLSVWQIRGDTGALHVAKHDVIPDKLMGPESAGAHDKSVNKALEPPAVAASPVGAPTAASTSKTEAAAPAPATMASPLAHKHRWRISRSNASKRKFCQRIL